MTDRRAPPLSCKPSTGQRSWLRQAGPSGGHASTHQAVGTLHAHPGHMVGAENALYTLTHMAYTHLDWTRTTSIPVHVCVVGTHSTGGHPNSNISGSCTQCSHTWSAHIKCLKSQLLFILTDGSLIQHDGETWQSQASSWHQHPCAKTAPSICCS